MRNRIRFAGSLVALTFVGLGADARADFLTGKDIQVEVDFQGSQFPGLTKVFTVVTGPNTPEIQHYGQADLSIDVNDTGPAGASFTIGDGVTTGFGASPNLLVFTTVSAGIPAFTNVTIDPSTSAVYNDSSRLSFSGNSVSFDFGGLSVNAGDHLILDTQGVPEPSTLALMTCGLLAVGGRWFRRRGRRPV